MWQTVSDGGFDCVRVGVGDFYGGGDFGDGLDGGDGCSQVAVAGLNGLNAPKSKTTSR